MVSRPMQTQSRLLAGATVVGVGAYVALRCCLLRRQTPHQLVGNATVATSEHVAKPQLSPELLAKAATAVELADHVLMDRCAADLEACGVATVEVGTATRDLHASCFEAAKVGLDAAADGCSPHAISPEADSAHVSGVHTAGALSQYNVCREGLVFSDGGTVELGDESFQRATVDFFESALSLASSVLRALERRMGIPEGWFDESFGPMGDHSQWHLKRYRPELAPAELTSNDGRRVLLPVHSDPSLISIVVHDSPRNSAGALGLEYLVPGGEWREVHVHGHRVVTVFVGSVLARITGGRYPAAKHRVAVAEPVSALGPRIVATFFFRPAPQAMLRPPPCDALRSVPFKAMSFRAWCDKVAKKYEKHKQEKLPPPPHGNVSHVEGTAVAGGAEGVAAESVAAEGAAAEGIVPQSGKKGTRLATASKEKKPKRTAAEAEAALRLRHGLPAAAYEPLVTAAGEELRLLGGPLLGQEKYLGGVLGDDGRIYAIPGHARRVLRIDPSSGVVDHIGPSFEGHYKWLRGVKVGGIIYGMPCHHGSVLRIDPATGHVSTFGNCGDGEWKWHGGVVAGDGSIYAMPQSAEAVLRIDPVKDAVSLVGGPFPGRNKWYGGLLGADGCIYGIPQNADSVLRIEPDLQRVTTIGALPAGGWKWHGGVVSDGVIYSLPAHADTVLRIDTRTAEVSEIGGPLASGKHRTDGKYKYLGGVLGRDGKIYGVPSDADHVLCIDPATQVPPRAPVPHQPKQCRSAPGCASLSPSESASLSPSPLPQPALSHAPTRPPRTYSPAPQPNPACTSPHMTPRAYSPPPFAPPCPPLSSWLRPLVIDPSLRVPPCAHSRLPLLGVP